MEELEKQLEIQSSIIKASKTLYEQASNRKLKKDRKKEIRQMEDKVRREETSTSHHHTLTPSHPHSTSVWRRG